MPASDADISPISALYLYLLLVGLILVVLLGLFVSALVIGWWGKRKALREGRCCPDCGAWDDAAEILIHRINEHWKG